MEKARSYMQKLKTQIAAAKIECLPWSGVTPMETLEGPVEIKCVHNACQDLLLFRASSGQRLDV